MAMELSPDQIKLVKSTIPILEANGTTVTKVFYDNLLRENPQLNNIFNKANQAHLNQPKALAAAVYAYAKNLENLAALESTVELVANKHASLYVQPEHYAIIGKYLIEAFQQVLGDAFTSELRDAWTAAYVRLADVFIKREKALYESTKGWTDWRDFKIAKMVKESDEITSFYLEPVSEDSLPLPPFLPGQYISIQVDVPELNHRQSRQYSLSDAPGPTHYRVSIKRESSGDPTDESGAIPKGLVSNLMHSKSVGDIVRVSHPMGDFFLAHESPPSSSSSSSSLSSSNQNISTNDNEADDSSSSSSFSSSSPPLVLMSGGVGLTCLTSILNSLMSRHSKRRISWIHAARSSNVRAFTRHVRDIEQSHENNVHVVLFNKNVGASDVRGRDYHHTGYIEPQKLDHAKDLFLSDKHTQYYICGPVQFMTNLENMLVSLGVSPDQIHMERFGTGGVPRAN